MSQDIPPGDLHGTWGGGGHRNLQGILMETLMEPYWGRSADLDSNWIMRGSFNGFRWESSRCLAFAWDLVVFRGALVTPAWDGRSGNQHPALLRGTAKAPPRRWLHVHTTLVDLF